MYILRVHCVLIMTMEIPSLDCLAMYCCVKHLRFGFSLFFHEVIGDERASSQGSQGAKGVKEAKDLGPGKAKKLRD